MWPLSEPAVPAGVFHSDCLDSRRQVSALYFRYFNKTVFNNRLPPNTAIYWNKRLLTTAGRCLQATVVDKRVAFIQLSVKICDTPERVRDTLLHEMCHAATWVLDGVQHTDHGPSFQFWADRANSRHPKLPAVNDFHNYTIRKRFTYHCQQCKNRIDRHSKSIDVDCQMCALCGGKFRLVENNVRGSPKSRPSSSSSSGCGGGGKKGRQMGLADFVRTNKRRMKQRFPRLTNGQIMQKLIKQYQQQVLRKR